MNFKKFIVCFGALGMLLSSCSRVDELDYAVEEGISQEITATFTDARTSVDNDWNTVWNNNDVMTVYVTRETSRTSKYGYSQFTYKGDGKFDGTVNRDFCSPWNWFAVYPSFHSSSSTSSTVTAEIEHPATQTMTGDTKTHIAGANDPIFGYALGIQDNPKIRMHHISSVLDFCITNGTNQPIKVTKVEFTAPEKIAGDFTADVNLWDGEVEAPVWKAANNAVKTVTLNVNNGVEIAKSASSDFYATIHPVSANGDYTIKVTATSGGSTITAEKTITANLTFKAGKYRTLNFTFTADTPVPTEKSYVKVTSAPSDWSGKYLIVDESAKKAFAYNSTSSYAATVTITNNAVAWNEAVAEYEMTIAKSSVEGQYDITAKNGKYLYSYNNGSTLLNDKNSTTKGTYYNNLAFNGGNVTMYSTRTGSDSPSKNYFGYASSKFGYSSSATSRKVQLYKLTETAPVEKKEQTLTFAEDPYEVTEAVGTTVNANTLSGAMTTVTYASSDESVATVAADGKLTIKGEGTATITATAAEDDTYKPATKSYTLIVTLPAPTPTEKSYVKVTSAPSDWSGKYLIVDESAKKAFDENASSYASTVTISSGKIAWSETVAKYEITVSASTVSGMYDMTTVKGKYMYSYRSGATTWNDGKTQSGNTYYNSLSINGGNVTMYSTRTGSGGSVNYFGYVSRTSDNPNSKNFGYKEDATTRTVQLYKLTGETPVEKKEQTLSFSKDPYNVTAAVGSTVDANTLSGAMTTVTYASSDESVATVAADGKLTIKGEGTATITATAAEDDTYKPATKTYTLNVTLPAPTPTTEKTYELVSTLTEGTYIICGRETASDRVGTWGCIFPPVEKSLSSIKTSNYCAHIQLATTAGVASITTDNADVIASEVELVKSGSNWLIKLKSDGKYMYYSNSKIAFTTSTSSAAHTMTSGSNKCFTVKCGSSQEFYHSGTDKGFGYRPNTSTGNIQFYKLTGETPVEKKEQTLSFSKDPYNVTAAVGSTVDANTLSGAMTTVTYASSDESVATVAADGKLTIKGEGTATITATAAEDDTYKPATKSYTLIVTLPAPTPTTEKTYELVSTLTEGTYIICGRETASDRVGTWGCIFPPVEKSLSSIKTTNYCAHIQLATTAGVASITTDNADVIASEVELVKSGSNWLIKLKSDGKYMYYNNSKIDFTTSTSSAAHTMTSGSNKCFTVKCGSSQEFYHSGTDKGFGYRPNTSTGNIQFYRLQGSAPAPSSSMNIENSKLAAYLDAVEKTPYFTNNTFGSYSNYYTSSLMKSNGYYSGSSSSNRLDQPAPVVLTWTGSATKVEVFTSSSKTTASRVASQTLTSSSTADIYNLIPGQKYYYTASNGSTTVATGEFTPEGRRRMMKVSSSFDDSHASNCRDFGGLPTVDGKHVKYGLIYRGSNIDKINSDSNAKDIFLNTMKIKWDIDLRASNEKGSAPTLSGVSKGTQSYSASFDDNNLRSKTKMSKTVKEVIDAINNNEPVYIHCRIGSDRTGYVCLLLEALIGVTQNYCDTDYEITSFTGSVTGTRFRVDTTAGGGMYRSGIQYFADYSGTTLHDKVYNFVTSSNGLNISKTDVDRFISNMTE